MAGTRRAGRRAPVAQRGAAFLAECAEGMLSADAQAHVLWGKTPRTKRSAPWSVGDLVFIDEAAGAIERAPSLGHVILDEAQDLSAMQLRAVGRRCATGSAPLLGDVSQATTPWEPGSWQATMGHLGKPEFHLEELVQGFRVHGAVIGSAARLLPVIAPGLMPPRSVRSNPGVLQNHRATNDTVSSTRRRHRRRGRRATRWARSWTPSICRTGGLEAAHGDDADHQLKLMPADVAKKLEFERMVTVGPSDIADAESDEATGLCRLYVVLTRAVSELHVFHARDLPELLGWRSPPLIR